MYHAKLPPIKEGIQKPMKPGGYSDSGADIVCELIKNGLAVGIPNNNPNINIDNDWVFPGVNGNWWSSTESQVMPGTAT